ncbi:MAG: excinuclease ABC subunit UvrC [Oscillospiraceae bacterium]|nr:excinuclease ABC subunit UvrC [Oscillospiraceae bacterium]
MNIRLPFLREKTAKLTTSPGVYIMKNKSGEIIYIGKAKNLKNRVTSYFREEADHTPKVASMVSNVYDYSFIVTDSEYEALVLECSLIKQHQPKYNILLKDDKGYSYIRISDEPYPRITSEKNKEKPGEYLGPYMSGTVPRETVAEVNRVFKLPTCHKRFPDDFRKGRPCLNYHINLCSGLCRGRISRKEYCETIEQAVEYIRGGSEESAKRMEREMEEAAERLDFERAAVLRDRINAIRKAGETQKIFDADVQEADVIASAENSGSQCISVLIYRSRRLFDKQTFFFSEEEYDPSQLIQSFLEQYYHGRRDIPKNIYVDTEIPESEMLEKWLSALSGTRVYIHMPQRGILVRFVELSKNNATEELALRAGRTAKEVKALETLGQILGLKSAPLYIEAYDVSNLSSSSIVAGMIVFENGRPLKKAYKRFSFPEKNSPDDYACMRETLRRRLTHLVENEGDEGFLKKPDLILLDGGPGHVNAVKPVLEELGLDIPLYGMVKDNKHRTRAIAEDGGEISVSQHRSAFNMLTQIQDEVHRFAVSYMHSRHKKNSYELELTAVKGIGLKKAQKLLIFYKTKENMKKASPEELAKTAGVNLETGKKLYEIIQNI